METVTLNDGIEQLKGVGPKRAALYRKLGIETVRDLLSFYPRDYLDLSHPLPITEAPAGEVSAVRGRVFKKQGPQRIRKGLTLYKVFATDGDGELVITIYNSQFLFDALSLDGEYCFYGKVTGSPLRREMSAPLCLPASETLLLRPVYALTEGLTNKMVQANMQDALAVWGDRLTDSLPSALRQQYSLCQLRYAVENIHFPADAQARNLARQRLVFEELLVLQLGLSLLRQKHRRQAGARMEDPELSPFLESLPFTLTDGQLQTIRDGIRDMTGRTPALFAGQADEAAPAPEEVRVPMNRLVQGDVGSGKTMVAAALCYVCVKNGFQAAVMAPTQILAEQHYATLERQLSPLGIRCCLLTSSLTPKARRQTLEGVESGLYGVVIGTHALLRGEVAFQALGLVVTDEQHRFGVAQRAALDRKGNNPHLLVMSATPIPRTLALIIYGDLDVSLIRELPKGRQPIDTFAIDPGKRGRALGFLKKQVDEGRQAYIVCPLIQEDGGELASITRYMEDLQKTPLSACRIGALHGKLKPREKEALMAAFQAGELQILVSTTVVEVGVDVPNANIMLIENAERFGLSQLHQLRGRVGRGQYKSYCVLISGGGAEDTRRRLQVMTSTSDGFRIAEEDLKLRGPGDFFGQRQHGLPELKIASIMEDMDVLEEARQAAQALLRQDPSLALEEHRGLRAEVRRLFSQSGQVAMN